MSNHCASVLSRILCLVNHSGSLLLAVDSSGNLENNFQARCCYCYSFVIVFVYMKSDFWQCAVGERERTMCLVIPALINLSILSRNIS